MSDVRRQPHPAPAAERYLSGLAEALSERASGERDAVVQDVRKYIDGSVQALGRPPVGVDYVRILDHLGPVDAVADDVARGAYTAPAPLPRPAPVQNRPKSILGGISALFGAAALLIFWVPLFGTTVALMTIIVAFFARRSPGVNRRLALIGLILGLVTLFLSVMVVVASVLTGA